MHTRSRDRGIAPTAKVVAAYAGDAQTNAKSSAATTVAVSAAGSGVTMTAVGQLGVSGVGVPVVLTASVTNTDHTTAVPGGVAAFSAHGAPVVGCTAVPVTGGLATCTDNQPPTALGAVPFGVTFCSSATGTCRDWTSSQSSTTYTPTKDPTSVTLSPGSTQTHPATATGGQPITVTATVALVAGSATVGGTVTFHQGVTAITASGGGSCSSEPVGPSGQASCTFVPRPGYEDTVTAAYTPAATSLTTASTSAPAYFKVSGFPTATTVGLAAPTGPLPAGEHRRLRRATHRRGDGDVGGVTGRFAARSRSPSTVRSTRRAPPRRSGPAARPPAFCRPNRPADR